LTVVTSPDTPGLTVKSGAIQAEKFAAALPKAKLWHFDHPNLYRLIFFNRKRTRDSSIHRNIRGPETRGQGQRILLER